LTVRAGRETQWRVKVDVANGAALLFALLCSMAAAAAFGPEREDGEPIQLTPVAQSQAVTRDGVRGLYDASGHFVPLRRYDRIISASSVADSLLLALCERQRIVAVSRQATEGSVLAYEMAGLPVLVTLENLEKVLSFSPDLVLVHNLDRIERANQLREAGVEVFDLGGMHGLSTLLPNIRSVALLLGRPQRGDELSRRFERRMRAVAARVPAAQRPRALYLGVHGDKFYGGAAGTSFHDVLTHAGLRDVAAERFKGWTRYSNEQLLMLDPEIVVTQTGMRDSLCAQAGLDALRACGGDGRIIELPPELILLPGLNMLEATEALYEAVHGG